MLVRQTALALVLLAALGGLAGPAGAHTQVQRATPGPGETVAGELDVVVLDFLDPVAPTPRIEVTGPDGQPVEGLSAVELIADDVAVARFDPLTEAGEYQVDYSFLSLDGDEQVSAFTFTFEPEQDLDVRAALAWGVGGVLVVLVGAAVVGRRRSSA